MGSNWSRNFAQYPISHYELFTDDNMRDIPYPYAELGIHATFKTVQIGSMVGGWILPAIINVFSTKTTLKDKVKFYGRYGVLVGLAAGPIVAVARILQANIDREGAIDRCYRLRYNKRQLFIDRCSIVAGAFGFYGARWLGLVNSVNGAIIVTIFYNAFIWNLVPRRFHDIAEEPPLTKTPKRKL